MERVNYNIVIAASANSPASGTDIQYREQFQQPILANCSNYYLAITRFQLPSSQIPLSVMPVKSGQANPNLTPFLITLTYLGVDYVANVVYIPDNNDIPPDVSSAVGGPVSEYYYIYSVEAFLASINACIAGLMTQIQTATSISTVAPYFLFNQQQQLLGFNCSYDYFEKEIILSVNYPMYKYFEFFRWRSNSDAASVAAGKEESLVITAANINWSSLPGVAISNPPAYLLSYEELSTSVVNWFAVMSIVVTTDRVPVAPEFTPVFGASNSGMAGVASRQIITDFQPNFASIIESRGIYSFSQTGPYRITPMIYDLPLDSFDLRVFWTDSQGNFIPWQLGPGESASFKISFIRKDTYFG